MKNLVIVVGGPTASGKSKLAIDLALELNGEIVNADSMQVYGDTPILSATPDSDEKSKVKHHLFGVYPSSFRGNVVDWLELCTDKIKDLWKENKIPVVVGGTGLYLKNLMGGTTPIPVTSPEIRDKISEEYKNTSLEHMYQKLCKADEESAQKISRNDKTRILRALEVVEATGIKLSDWHKQPMVKKLPQAHFFFIKLIPDLNILQKSIELRLDKMVQQGAVNEVRTLLEKNIPEDLPAMKALGVPEFADFIIGKISLEEAITATKLHTRQYAKRQLTWFRNQIKADYEIRQCYKGEKNIVDDIEKALQNSCVKKD